MRDTKFRWWHTKYKRMFYNIDELYEFVDDKDFWTLERCKEDKYIYEDEWYVPKYILEMTFTISECCDCEPMQFIGHFDKNGKSIFEDDIVRDVNGGIYKVVYDTEYIRFAFEQDNIKWGLEAFDNIKDFEVIGNVWENPELLGGGE